MCNVNELQKKVEHAIECCTDHGVRCKECPYTGIGSMCSRRLMSDAQKVINYYKCKYECSLLATPPMILHDPSPIRIEPVDVKATLKAIRAMDRMEKAARTATEAMNEAKQAIRELKEELQDD